MLEDLAAWTLAAALGCWNGYKMGVLEIQAEAGGFEPLLRAFAAWNGAAGQDPDDWAGVHDHLRMQGSQQLRLSAGLHVQVGSAAQMTSLHRVDLGAGARHATA